MLTACTKTSGHKYLGGHNAPWETGYTCLRNPIKSRVFTLDAPLSDFRHAVGRSVNADFFSSERGLDARFNTWHFQRLLHSQLNGFLWIVRGQGFHLEMPLVIVTVTGPQSRLRSASLARCVFVVLRASLFSRDQRSRGGVTAKVAALRKAWLTSAVLRASLCSAGGLSCATVSTWSSRSFALPFASSSAPWPLWFSLHTLCTLVSRPYIRRGPTDTR